MAWVFLIGGGGVMVGSWFADMRLDSGDRQLQVSFDGGSLTVSRLECNLLKAPIFQSGDVIAQTRMGKLERLGYFPRAHRSRNDFAMAGLVWRHDVLPWMTYSTLALPLWPPLLATAGMLYWDRRHRKRLGGKGFEVVSHT
jgi:hypothetical protein